jgi:siroheme synthase-like protein
MPLSKDPNLLDLSRKSVVIVGGGTVAVRKAQRLLECGTSRVQVNAPSVSSDMRAQVEIVRREYHAGELEGASLVYSATDSPEVNARPAGWTRFTSTISTTCNGWWSKRRRDESRSSIPLV